MKSKNSDVHIVTVVDGRPGHEKQTFGIVHALSKRISVTTSVIDVSKRGVFPQWCSYAELFLGLPLQTVKVPSSADLIIGTGTRTHTTILNLKKHFKVPAVTCMTPGLHLRNCFDICFVPEHDAPPVRSNFFCTCGAPNSNYNKGEHNNNEGLILLGGVDEKSHVWDSDSLVEKIIHVVSREDSVRWTLSSSPRTPPSTVDLLRTRLQPHENCTFFDFENTEKGWVEEQYHRCKTVWVTTDSISMLYEALSSGCTVNVFKMPWKRESSKFKRNEDLLISQGLVTPFSHWRNGNNRSSASSEFNESQRCAEHILQTCL